jgi:hypothetical protein
MFDGLRPIQEPPDNLPRSHIFSSKYPLDALKYKVIKPLLPSKALVFVIVGISARRNTLVIIHAIA